MINNPVAGLVNWFRKHWDTFLGRPINGEKSLVAIQDQLTEIRAGRKELSSSTSKLISDTESARKAIKEGHAAIRPNS